MKIGGAYTLAVPQQRAYSLLQDPDVLAQCMPGCDHLTRIADNEYEMKMKMAISAVQGLFTGTVRIADSHPPSSFRLIVEGSGKVGFMKGDGLLTLMPEAASTEVRYEGDVQVGGLIAGVGKRLIDVTARLLIKRFFEKLAEQIALQPAP
ncbi:MAG: carbon monoxide dehydrogenase subunit G [Acidobacteria bacterium]|nr:carbon monoxide dehydrogenase subunit G [Acidobacteriota bacterium]